MPDSAFSTTLTTLATLGVLALQWSSGPKSQAQEAPLDEEPEVLGSSETEEEDDIQADDDWTYEATTTAPAPAVTASQRTVTHEEIREAVGATADELLRIVPGMVVVQHGTEGKGHQFFVRGFDAIHGADVEVRVAGIPLNEASNVHSHGYLDLAFLIPEVVSSIDVRKGAVEVDQAGFGTAATVDYRLGVAPGERGLRLAYQAGTTNRHRALTVWAPRRRSSSDFAAFEALYDAGFGQNRRSRRLTLLSQGRLWSGHDGAGLTGLLGAYIADFGLPGIPRLEDVERGRIGFADSYSEDTGGDSRRVIASAELGIPVADTDVRLLGYGQIRGLSIEDNYTGYLQNEELGDRFRQEQTAGSGGARVEVTTPLPARLTLTGLASWHTDTIDLQEHPVDAAGEPWSTDRDHDIVQHFAGGGVSLHWIATSWLDVDAGARVDLADLTLTEADGRSDTASATLFQWSPRLSLVGYPGLDWTLYGSYGHGFRPPEARSVLASEAPDEDVSLDRYQGGQPEMTVARNVELGVRWQAHARLDVALAGFGVWIDREMVFDHVSSLNLELNGTRRLGGELDVSWRPWDWMELRGDVVLVEAHFIETGNPIPGAPPLVGNARLSVNHSSGFRGGLHVLALGPRPLEHGAEAGAVAVLELTAGRRWEHVALELEVENVLNADWREGEYHFASWWDRSQARSQLPRIHYSAGPPLSAILGVSWWL